MRLRLILTSFVCLIILSPPDIGPDVPDHAPELDAKPRGQADDPSHQKDPRQSYGVVGTLRVQSIATCDELAMSTVLLNFLGVCRQLWRTESRWAVYAGSKNAGQLHPGRLWVTSIAAAARMTAVTRLIVVSQRLLMRVDIFMLLS